MKPTKYNKSQILWAAFNVFTTKGFEKAEMQDIANEAGIDSIDLNYYYASKDLLYHELMNQF